MSLRLVRAGVADAEQVAQIESACYEPQYCWPPDRIAEHLEQPEAQVFTVYDGEDVVGALWFEWVDEEVVYLTNVAVLPGMRGRGYGRAIMEEFHLMVGHLGARRVELHVALANTPATRIYEQMGYGVRETVSDYYTDGGAALLMDYTLEPCYTSAF